MIITREYKKCNNVSERVRPAVAVAVYHHYFYLHWISIVVLPYITQYLHMNTRIRLQIQHTTIQSNDREKDEEKLIHQKPGHLVWPNLAAFLAHWFMNEILTKAELSISIRLFHRTTICQGDNCTVLW